MLSGLALELPFNQLGEQGEEMITITIMIICLWIVWLIAMAFLVGIFILPIGFFALFVGFLLGRLCAIIKARITHKPIKK